MVKKHSLSVRLFAFFVSTGIVLGGLPAHANGDLTDDQVNGLMDCQRAINEGGRKFLKSVVEGLEECAELVVEIELREENSLPVPSHLETKAEAECVKAVKRIGERSTRLIDGIIEECTPVEEILLDETNDPLGFQNLVGGAIGFEIGEEYYGGTLPSLDPFESVEELGGFICATKLILGAITAGLENPRFLFELLGELGGGFDLDSLDERCSVEFVA